MNFINWVQKEENIALWDKYILTEDIKEEDKILAMLAEKFERESK